MFVIFIPFTILYQTANLSILSKRKSSEIDQLSVQNCEWHEYHRHTYLVLGKMGEHTTINSLIVLIEKNDSSVLMYGDFF